MNNLSLLVAWAASATHAEAQLVELCEFPRCVRESRQGYVVAQVRCFSF